MNKSTATHVGVGLFVDCPGSAEPPDSAVGPDRTVPCQHCGQNIRIDRHNKLVDHRYLPR